MGIEIVVAQIESMLFGEAPYAGFHPRIAPAEEEAWQIRQRKRGWREMGHDGGGFDVNRSASIRHIQTKIDVIQERNQPFIKRAETIKDIPAHEHAMEFDEANGLANELRTNL